MFQSLSFVNTKKATFIAGILVAVFSLVGMGTIVSKASAADCDSNAIIYCGFTSPSNFISKVKSNDSRNGHHDLVNIYKAYGLESADYDRFVTHAKQGTAYKDGRIVVGGQVVGTNGTSIGREAGAQGSGYFTQTIAGQKYYGNTNAKAFKSNSIPVTVLFNAKGQVEFAVLNACGNPEHVHVVTPTYSCNKLNMSAVSGKANTYAFSTSASAGNNAKIVKVVYNFGDGTPAVTQSNPATKVNHTYTKAGHFTAKVSVYVSLPGNQQVVVSNGNCAKTVTVVMPFYQCVQLAGSFIDKDKMSFRFVATAKYGNGAKFVSADFNFGDGKSAQGVKPATATTATVTHTYQEANKYDVKAILHFTANGKNVTAPTCAAMVTPTTPPTPECKPGVPMGSPECTPPCQFNSSLPATSPKCGVVSPAETTLPNTGAGNTIAIFSAVVVAGFLGYRHVLYRRHRAAFLAAEQGISPLEEPVAPKAAAARKAKSLRRPRRF